jgi:hypothetical protein
MPILFFIGFFLLFSVSFVFVIAYRQFQLRDRTIDEVIIFLRKIDWEELAAIYDIGAEYKSILFADSDYQCFRRSMRVRIHTAREFAWRMYNNARVIHQWASTELADLPTELDGRRKEQEEKIKKLLFIAIEARATILMHLVKLTAWTVFRADRWPRAKIPSVASLRKSPEQCDLIELYTTLKVAAADLALRYGRNFHDEVLAAF